MNTGKIQVLTTLKNISQTICYLDVPYQFSSLISVTWNITCLSLNKNQTWLDKNSNPTPILQKKGYNLFKSSKKVFVLKSNYAMLPSNHFHLVLTKSVTTEIFFMISSLYQHFTPNYGNHVLNPTQQNVRNSIPLPCTVFPIEILNHTQGNAENSTVYSCQCIFFSNLSIKITCKIQLQNLFQVTIQTEFVSFNSQNTWVTDYNWVPLVFIFDN